MNSQIKPITAFGSRLLICAAAAASFTTCAVADTGLLDQIDSTRFNVNSDEAAYGSSSLYHLYVSTTGSDSGTGSETDPFRTIQKASSVAKPSTTIHVAAGTYNGNVVTNASGTADGRIIFLYKGKPKWGAKIVGTGTEVMWTNNGSYVDIIGFDVTGPGRLGILNYGSHTTIAHSHVHNLAVSGGCTGNGGAGILNGSYSASDNDIISNVVHDIGQLGACNQVQGIYHSNLRGHVFNNIVYRASSWGIHLWHAANNVVVANNTVFANGSATMGGGMVIGAGDSPGGIVLDYTKVINNILYNNPNVGFMEYCNDGDDCIGSHNTVAHNLVKGSARPIIMKVGADVDTITEDPLFKNYQADGSGNYRLRKDSPAVDKGTADSAPTQDINKVVRPRGAGFDIGAYESH